MYFTGVLANVDSSILKVKLEHGFEIKAIPENGFIGLFSILEGFSNFTQLHIRLFHEYLCLDITQNRVFVITNSIDLSENTDKSAIIDRLIEEVDNYLVPTIQLMRLFKEGNICMPLEYFYIKENSTSKPHTGRKSPRPTSHTTFTLEDSEIVDLQTFLKDTKVPFTEPFLQLAFENFELSYQTPNNNLSFLALMIGLESLFNPGEQELRYRISRNTAVLLGKTKDDSKRIFSEVKQLYDKRSKIVHKGESGVINREDLRRLHHYVRESIKEVYRIGKGKDELIDMLNSYGFGERER